MIFGANRTPFARPAAASGSFQPKLPHTGFFSHFHPLTQVTHAMRAASMYRPPLVPSMGPQPLPAIAAPQPAAPVAPTVPTPGGTAGFGGAGFGSTGGTMGHMHVDPYMVMRQGVIPGVSPSGSNIRYGVTHAGQRVHRSMPFQTAPLPPLPPPPPAMPAVPATGVKGLLGALSDHLGFPTRRSFFHRRHPMMHPQLGPMAPSAVASSSCERLGPNSNGLYVTVCDGHVTQYDDGHGNVQPYMTA